MVLGQGGGGRGVQMGVNRRLFRLNMQRDFYSRFFLTTDDCCATHGQDATSGGRGCILPVIHILCMGRNCPESVLGPLCNLSHSSVAVAVTHFPVRSIGQVSLASLRGRGAGGCMLEAFHSVEIFVVVVLFFCKCKRPETILSVEIESIR